LALILWALTPVQGDEPEPLARPEGVAAGSVASFSRSFVAYGPDQAVNLALATQAEDMKRRVERFFEVSISIGREQPLTLHMLSDRPRNIQVAQGYDGPRLVQRVYLHAEDDLMGVREALCLLLAGRYMLELPRREDRMDHATLPAWFASGLAVYLYPELRDVYRRQVAEYAASGRLLPLGEVLQRTEGPFPLGTREQVSAFALVNALASERKHRPVMAHLLRRASRGEPFLEEDLIASMEQVGNARELAMFWETAVAGLGGGRMVFAGLSGAESLERMEWHIHTISMEYASFIPPEDPPLVEVEDLLRYRGRPWISDLWARVRLEIMMILLEQPHPDLHALGDGYDRFFRELSLPEPSRAGFWSSRLNDRRLRQHLADLEQEVGRMRALHAEQRRYLDAFEASLEHAERPEVRAEHRAYLDEVEQRLRDAESRIQD